MKYIHFVVFRTAILCAAAVSLAATALSQGTFSTFQSVHFRIEYQRGISERDARGVSGFLEEEYKYLSAKLGIDLRTQVVVRIYDAEGKYLSQSGERVLANGAAYRRGVLHVQPVHVLVERGILEQSLSYELAMALLDPAVVPGCPRWLRHAFAVYHSGKIAGTTPPINPRYAGFADLDQDIQQYSEGPRRADIEGLLGLTMKFFLARFGEEPTMALFRSFDGSGSYESILSSAFQIEFPSIQNEWAEYISLHTLPERSPVR